MQAEGEPRPPEDGAAGCWEQAGPFLSSWTTVGQAQQEAPQPPGSFLIRTRQEIGSIFVWLRTTISYN